MLRDYEGHVTAVDFGDYAEANPARTPATAYYYYDATMHIYPDDAECFARSYHEGGDRVVVVRCADGTLLASVICTDAYSAQCVLVALSNLDGPTLALTLGLLWSCEDCDLTADHAQLPFDYDWIDAVTLGVWTRDALAMDGSGPPSCLVGRITIYDDDPYFCSVSVECERITTCRDVYLGEDSDPDSPWFMGSAVDLACEWIEATVTGRPLPTGGEC